MRIVFSFRFSYRQMQNTFQSNQEEFRISLNQRAAVRFAHFCRSVLRSQSAAFFVSALEAGYISIRAHCNGK